MKSFYRNSEKTLLNKPGRQQPAQALIIFSTPGLSDKIHFQSIIFSPAFHLPMQTTWDATDSEQIHATLSSFCTLLSDNFSGIYLYGSATLGQLRPHRANDLLILTECCLDQDIRC